MEDEPPLFDWILFEVIAKGSKGDLNAKSKQWKSFFAMQLAYCIAAGLPFLNWPASPPRRVAYFDLDLLGRGTWERFDAMRKALGGTPGGALYIYPCRFACGKLRKNLSALVADLRRKEIDLVILDPRYKLIGESEDENSAAGLHGVLDFRDNLIKETGAAVLIVGHDPKGDVSGKDKADRGAGSYTAGADFDFAFALSPHELDGYSVLSTSSRYRQTPPDLSICFDPERLIFEADPDTPATKKQTKPGGRGATADPKDEAARESMKLAALEKAVCDFADKTPLMDKTTFLLAVGKMPEGRAFGGVKRREAAIKSFLEKGLLAQTDKWLIGADGKRKKAGGRNHIIGAPSKVKQYADEFNMLDL
jgi:hypothetical protein